MAYTDKDAIYEIAEKLGYQGDEGLTTTEAVYAVASALGYTGEHDKSVALALSDLNTVVGGGGGGVDLGPIGTAAGASGTPEVGKMSAESPCIAEARVGDQLAVTSGDGQPLSTSHFAAGLTLTTPPVQSDTVVCSAYVVTLDSNSKYATVKEWDGTVTRREVTAGGSQAWVWDFVMPELAEGEAIELFLHT
jgi:hypothetical protein